MKLTNEKKASLPRDNEQKFTEQVFEPMSNASYMNLIILVAQMFDEIAKGREMFMIIGATSKRDTYSVTIKDAGVPTSVYATSLEELCTLIADLL